MKKEIVVRYTLGEELINSISHGIGAALAIAGMILLIIKANNVAGILTSIVYSIILIVMYTISCIYHALSPKLRGKEVLLLVSLASKSIYNPLYNPL